MTSSWGVADSYSVAASNGISVGVRTLDDAIDAVSLTAVKHERMGYAAEAAMRSAATMGSMTAAATASSSESSISSPSPRGLRPTMVPVLEQASRL